LLSGQTSLLALFLRGLHFSGASSLYRCHDALARFHSPERARVHEVVAFFGRLFDRTVAGGFGTLANLVKFPPLSDA